MQCKTLAAGPVVALIIGLTPCLATAGPFADDMAKCLVRSTSDADRADLVRWMFSAMSLHPALASMSAITDKSRDELNAKAGQLFGRLLLESCKSETVDAVKNEGPQTIQYAFQILGQVAASGLFTDPHVSGAMQAVAKSVDQEKLKALLTTAATK